MRRRVVLSLCVAAVAAVGTVVAIGRADQPAHRPADRPRFEYKVLAGGAINASGEVERVTPESLNKLGADGWELGSVVVSQPPFSTTTMYLKRAVKP